MSDNGPLDIRPGKTSAPKPVAYVELRIRYTPASKVISVTGPVNDRAMCYLMLEMARDVVHGLAMQNKQEQDTPKPDGEPKERKRYGD